jgi:PAS domain S-box-containing protein
MLKSDKAKRSTDNKSFDELLSGLSLRLLKVHPRNIDSEIRQSIMEIGEHYRVDRVDLRKFCEDRSTTTLLHWWVRGSEIGLSADLPNDQVPWAASLILRGEAIRIGRLADMPAEAAAGRAMLEMDGLCAAMLVPLMVDDQLFGTFVFASQEEREWSDEIVRECQLLGDAVAVAYIRAQLHNSLWTSEIRLRAVLENQTELIVRWLPDGTRTWVNDKYCEFFQQSRESMIGTSFLPLVVPAGRQEVLNIVKAMTPDKPTNTVEHQVLLPSGETGWQRWTDKGIFDESGKLIEIQSVGRDITNRKRAVQAQFESEARYRDLIENTTDWIWEMNLNLKHTYSNHQLEVILGYTTDELQELSLQQLFHPDDLLEVEARLPDLIDSKSGWEQWELRFRHKNGSYRHLQSNAHPVFDDEGKMRGFHGIDRDITESVISRDVIERSEQKYRTVVESANDSIWLMDGDQISDCNKKALDIFDRKREELIGKTPWDISPDYQSDGSTSKDLGRAILKDVRSGNPRRFDWLHVRPDGTPIDMEISLTPIELVDDGPRLLAVGRDMTDARRALREIERRAEFQRRLADLSASLSTVPIEESEQRVEEELGRVGVQYELGGVEIWWLAGDEGAVMHRHAGWRVAQDTCPVPSDHEPRTKVPWFANRVLRGETIQIDDVGDMPDEARTDQASMQKWGMLSVLGIPARIEEKMIGCCIFTSSEQRNWEKETVQELRLIADALTGACARIRATEELMRSEQDMLRSQETARVGSYSFVPEDTNADFPPKGKLELSPQFRELYGLDAGPASFEQVVSRIHPDDSKRVVNSINNAVASGTRFVETYRVVRPDGTILYLENRPYIVAGEAGRTNRIFGTVQDVTERIESRKKIEGALEEIEKLKDQLQEENLYLREEIRAAHGFDKIIGGSAKLSSALKSAEKVAATDVNVLILGETGTGKELIAQAIHDLSYRKDNALISVNCAALSKDLIESELFGHEKGAFTGAHTQRKGRFELADGGTLFLDEIGELPGELQAKLLRVLQAGEFERLGGSQTLHVDVRLIAATNKNLKRAVDKGEFRADLYYRINSFPIVMPPLRERPDDIPALAEFLTIKHAKRMGKEIKSISAGTIRFLIDQKWPGNVRELEGFIQRALISTTGPILDYSESYDSEPESSTSSDSIPADEPADLRSVERQHILKVLEGARWVIDGKRGAASMMGVAPSTLRSKMKRLGIKRAT